MVETLAIWLPASAGAIKKGAADVRLLPLVLGLAATYSPGGEPSTIGAPGLNGSVRNGKRCSPGP